MRFDATDQERSTLRDGSEVTLRPIRPEHKALLRAGFERLSADSRYTRFFTAKLDLTDKELEYLTDVDGTNHFALGAIVEGPDGEQGVGVARFVRDEDDPEVAEPAVTVVDDWQGKGLGNLLMQRLADAARERGIRRFHCLVLDDNAAARRMLERLSPALRVADAGYGALDVEVDLPDPEHPPEETALHRLFRHIAEAAVSVPLGRRLLKALGGEDPPPR